MFFFCIYTDIQRFLECITARNMQCLIIDGFSPADATAPPTPYLTQAGLDPEHKLPLHSSSLKAHTWVGVHWSHSWVSGTE